MKMRELEHFPAVVDSGSFNRAFALYVSQQSQVKGLPALAT